MAFHETQRPKSENPNYGIHVLPNWVYANEAARTAATGFGDTPFSSSDVGKCVQQGTGGAGTKFFILAGHDPIVWVGLSNETIGIATDTILGIVKGGDGSEIDINGAINVPLATDSVAGRVKVGSGLSVGIDGTLSVATAVLGTLISLGWLSWDSFNQYDDDTITINLPFSCDGPIMTKSFSEYHYSTGQGYWAIDSIDSYPDDHTTINAGLHVNGAITTASTY